jgi:membrane protein insertase Oxa1/YidC/SpoIIIJ
MQTKFIPSNVKKTQNCNLCFLNQSRSLSCQRHKDIMTPTHQHFNVNNYSRTLCLTLLPQVQSSQRRQFSAETWKYYSSTDFPPVNVAYESFIAIHEFTGLPWWATVILSTVLLRSILTLPLFVVSQATIARYKNVQTDLKEISVILKMDVFKYSRENNLSHIQSDRLLKQEVCSNTD